MPRAERHRSRRSLGRFARAGLATALFVVGGFLAFAFVGIAVQTNAVARETASLRAEIAGLQGQRAALQAAAAEKQTDAYVVDKARDLGYVRPGEALIAVQREPSSRVSTPSPDGQSRIARWIELFFGAR